jgi:hypothetical protein
MPAIGLDRREDAPGSRPLLENELHLHVLRPGPRPHHPHNLNGSVQRIGRLLADEVLERCPRRRRRSGCRHGEGKSDGKDEKASAHGP